MLELLSVDSILIVLEVIVCTHMHTHAHVCMPSSHYIDVLNSFRLLPCTVP